MTFGQKMVVFVCSIFTVFGIIGAIMSHNPVALVPAGFGIMLVAGCYGVTVYGDL